MLLQHVTIERLEAFFSYLPLFTLLPLSSLIEDTPWHTIASEKFCVVHKNLRKTRQRPCDGLPHGLVKLGELGEDGRLFLQRQHALI